jgi:hypothetical protein
MMAYVFWHAPLAEFSSADYGAALLDFQKDLMSAPPSGLASCAAYQISEVPWMKSERRYEDWYFVNSCGDLTALNEAAVKPARWEVHARIATKMEAGQGGLYQHLHGEQQPLGGAHAMWLTRPRGIRYERPLQDMIGSSTGFVSCWRRQMVLGPGDEFVIIGTSSLAIDVPQGWQSRTVDRRILAR